MTTQWQVRADELKQALVKPLLDQYLSQASVEEVKALAGDAFSPTSERELSSIIATLKESL